MWLKPRERTQLYRHTDFVGPWRPFPEVNQKPARIWGRVVLCWMCVVVLDYSFSVFCWKMDRESWQCLWDRRLTGAAKCSRKTENRKQVSTSTETSCGVVHLIIQADISQGLQSVAGGPGTAGCCGSSPQVLWPSRAGSLNSTVG